MYLHWFDRLFHRANGPAQWANARLVRYADDFVVLARYQGPRLRGWIEEKIEKWLKLEINRDKTRVVDLREEKGESGFSGLHVSLVWRPVWARYQISECRDIEEGIAEGAGPDSEMTDRRQGCTPIPRLIDKLNRQLEGWANYFSLGYPRDAYRNINWHLGYRLANHLQHHCSQRPYQLPEGMSLYEHLQRLGLRFLRIKPCESR